MKSSCAQKIELLRSENEKKSTIVNYISKINNCYLITNDIQYIQNDLSKFMDNQFKWVPNNKRYIKELENNNG